MFLTNSVGFWSFADFYADSVLGSDAYAGNTEAQAFATLGKLNTEMTTAGANTRAGLAYGSLWEEDFDITAIDGASLTGYGSGSLPVIDGASAVAETWTQHDAGTYPNTWNIAVTQDWNVNQARMMIWEDGVLLKRVASIAAVNAEAGTYYSPQDNLFIGVTSNTVYIHATGSGNPNSNGKSYERTTRLYVVNGAFGPAGGQVVRYASIGRQGHNDGSLILGKNSTIDHVLCFDGHKHNALQESGVCSNSALINGQPEVNYLHVFYTGNASGLTGAYANCVFVGEEDGGRGTAGIYNHDLSSVAHDSLEITGCAFANVSACLASTAGVFSAQGVYAENVGALFNSLYVPGEITLSHALVNGIYDSNTIDAGGSDRDISHCAVYVVPGGSALGFVRTVNDFGTVNLNDCSFYKGSSYRLFSYVSGTGTFNMRRNVVLVDFNGTTTTQNQIVGTAGTLGTINDNVYYCLNGTTKAGLLFSDGTNRTIAQWQALGYDTNSLFIDESDIAFSDLVENDPITGDFRLRSDTGLTLPDSTPIHTLGAQQHWNFETQAVVSTPPTRWPVTVKTKADGESFVVGTWDFYPPATPIWTDALSNQIFTELTGAETYDVSPFVAMGGTVEYSLVTPPTGVSINSSTGVITINTDTAAVQTGTVITVRAANSEDADFYADATFNLTIASAVSQAEIRAIGAVAKAVTAVTTFDVTAPATNADDVIVLIALVENAVTATAPANFTQVITNAGSADSPRQYVWVWDGTGTRPNSNAQTVTQSASDAPAMGVIIAFTGSGIGNSGALAFANATTHQSASYAASAGSLAVHLWGMRTTQTISSTSYTGATPDQTTLSAPDTEGRLDDNAGTNVRLVLQTVEIPTAATVNRMTITSSFIGFGGVSFEVLG